MDDLTMRATLVVAQAAAPHVIAWMIHRRRLKTRCNVSAADILTLPEVAEKLGLTYKTALRTIERGYFKKEVKAGRFRLIRATDLEEFRAAAKQAGYEPI